MKLVVIPKNKHIDKFIKQNINTFIFGLDHFAINYPLLTILEIKEVLDKHPNIELFISINKNIFNKDLDQLNDVMQKLNTLPIKGVLFYDLAVLSIYQKNSFNYDLVWHQTHMVTNYNTCNYYYNKKVKYGVLASEITKDEMIEIKKNTKMHLFVFLIGHMIMSCSRRKLLTNFYESIGQKYDLTSKTITENNNEYIVNESNLGTNIITGDIINGIEYLQELNMAGIEYGIINGLNIADDILDKIVFLAQDVLNNNSSKSINELQELIGHNTGFFNKKTIYKVK